MAKMVRYTPSGMKRLGCPCKEKSSWMGEGKFANGATDIGLSLMSATTIFSVWSAISPSYATYKSFFSRTPEERSIALQTLLLSLGASTLSSLGIYLVFKRIIPAIAGQVSALGLFGLGMYAINSTPPAASTMEQKRVDQLTAAGQIPIGSNAPVPVMPPQPIPTTTPAF
jgi:hypothetical protein